MAVYCGGGAECAEMWKSQVDSKLRDGHIHWTESNNVYPHALWDIQARRLYGVGTNCSRVR